MRVLILYNEPILPKDHPEADSEHEIIRYSLDADKSFNECDAGVFCILRRLGHSWRVEPVCIAASTEDFDTKLLDLIAEKN